MNFYPQLNACIHRLEQEFSQIPEERKQILAKMAAYIRQKQEQKIPAQFNFICTHNSRRSHLAQIWAQAAAAYYGIREVYCYSGGTEATAFNSRAVAAMHKAGFQITTLKEGDNPLYSISFAEEAAPLKVWSKRFDDEANPASSFCAVMTCSDADQNCPFVPGVELRLGITYEDPKRFDGTAREAEKYNERLRQIGREMLYAYSIV